MVKSFAVITVAIGLTLGFKPAVSSPTTDDWPTHRVRIVVPFSAGGVADAISRMIGNELSNAWGVPVVVDNVPGANGNIGMGELVRNPADGHTIVLAPNGNLAINQHLFNNLPFDVYEDVAPVVLIANSDNVLVTSGQSEIRTFEEFKAHAKEQPNGVTYASPGVGSTHHLAGAVLGDKIGVDALHVPYKGFAPAIANIVSGEVDMMFLAVATAAPLIEAGRMTPLAVGSPQRAETLPDVPALAELGYPDFDAVSWYSFVVRKGTPAPVVEKIYQTTKTALENTNEQILEQGLRPSGMGPDELTALIWSDDERWGSVIADLGLEKQ